MPTTSEHPLLVQLAIQTTAARMLNAIDSLDWKTFRASFTETVALDYTSLFPGVPETLAIDTLLGRWVPLAHGYDGTQHHIGPVIVTSTGDERATAETQVRAAHYLREAEGGPIWVAAGRYRFTMEKTADGWKIAGIILTMAYQEGNRGLPALAEARGAAGQGRLR